MSNTVGSVDATDAVVMVVADVGGGADDDGEEGSAGGLDALVALSLREKTVIPWEVRGEVWRERATKREERRCAFFVASRKWRLEPRDYARGRVGGARGAMRERRVIDYDDDDDDDGRRFFSKIRRFPKRPPRPYHHGSSPTAM